MIIIFYTSLLLFLNNVNCGISCRSIFFVFFLSSFAFETLHYEFALQERNHVFVAIKKRKEKEMDKEILV